MTIENPSALSQHYADFYSPGTFTAEMTRKPLSAWSVDEALAAMTDITERHGAKPYGFRFITRARGPNDLDAREVAKSPMHYVGGKVETLAEIEVRNDPREHILRSNMRINGWDRVWRSTTGWQWTQPLNPDDVVLAARTGGEK